MSTLALSGSEMSPDGAQRGSGEAVAEPARAEAPAILRYLDLALLALALPVFLVADWPMLGYAVAAGAWIAQRLVMAFASTRVARSLAAGNRRDAFRTTALSGLGRVWLVSVAALLVGLLAEREDGLAAALLLTALFTLQLAISALTARGEDRA